MNKKIFAITFLVVCTAFFSIAKPSVAAPCDDYFKLEDQLPLVDALIIASGRTIIDHFVIQFPYWVLTLGKRGACVQAAENLQSTLKCGIWGSLFPDWQVKKIHILGHTANLLTSPDGKRHFLLDNYLVPTILPMTKFGDVWLLV